MIRNASQKFSCFIYFFFTTALLLWHIITLITSVIYMCIFAFLIRVFFFGILCQGPLIRYGCFKSKLLMKQPNDIPFLNIVITIKYLHCFNSWLLANTTPLKRCIVLYSLNIIEAEASKVI